MSPQRILIVDDEPEIVELLVLMFPELETESSQNVEEALDKLRARRFDVLVTDIRLPGISGSELIMKARELAPDLPIVVITGHYQSVSDEERSSIHALVLKPFRRREIREAVFDALGRPNHESV